uniref:PilS cassette n=1 Tax=Bursaphelenchus xylophilus TaxID=6326 RepID=A0A1I7SKW2_BURXY
RSYRSPQPCLRRSRKFWVRLRLPSPESKPGFSAFRKV